MRLARFILAVCLIGFLAHPSLAQTTFTSGDCNSHVTITGAGLTLTADASSTYRVCRASNPKFSGKWYYTLTPTVVATGIYVGVASGPTVVGGLDVANCSNFTFNGTGCGGLPNSSYIAGGNGSIFYKGFNIITGVGNTNVGVTSAVAVDLDSDPPQFWFTPDVTGTSGHGSGPLWNGSSASSPEVAGTGIPTTGGTGALFVLMGQLQNPFAVIANSDSLTFSFATFAPFTTLLPSYSPWNTGGGGPPTPGPLSPMESQISNAPGFATSTAYTTGARVNAGPGWNGTAYTSGSKLCLFGLVTPGTSGSDPSVFNTACTSGTPSNVGGMPGGSWPGATTVTSGGATFALLTVVDEVTLTGAPADTNTAWAPSTIYINGSYVLHDCSGNTCNAYVQVSQAADTCTSGSTGPIGIAFNGLITPDGTCAWASRATILYSSHNAMPGHQVNYKADGSQPELGIYYDIHFNLWSGGTGAPKYWAGHGGENDPITEWDLQDLYGEGAEYCWHGYPFNVLPSPSNTPAIFSCNGQPWLIRYKPAPGDGFVDNAPTGPLGYGDSTKGVMVFSDSTPSGGTNPPGSAMLVDSSGLFFNGMQIFSTNGAAIGGNGENITPGWNGHVDALYLQGNILYAGGQGGVVSGDGGDIVLNNVFVYAGANTVCYGMYNKFEGTVAFNTFIGPGSGNAQCAAILDFEGAFGTSAPIQKYDNAMFGFHIPWLTQNPLTSSPGEVGASNITDVPSAYTTSTFSYLGQNYIGQQLVGTAVNSASAAAAFVNPTVGASLDLRVANSSSPLYGAGVTFANNGSSQVISIIPYPPTVDIYNNARPTVSRFDVGSQQFVGAPPPASVLRLRFGFGR